MALNGEYLGMAVSIDDTDKPNQEFYTRCGSGALHLQACGACDLMRYPTTTACPWCSAPEYEWRPVSGRGTVYSYCEVHHAIQSVFRPHLPYSILLVELDEQIGAPNEHDGLRVTGNLVTTDGDLAPEELVRSVGIGSRVRVVLKDLGGGLALPQWCLDADADQPAKPWRYADD